MYSISDKIGLLNFAVSTANAFKLGSNHIRSSSSLLNLPFVSLKWAIASRQTRGVNQQGRASFSRLSCWRHSNATKNLAKSANLFNNRASFASFGIFSGSLPLPYPRTTNSLSVSNRIYRISSGISSVSAWIQTKIFPRFPRHSLLFPRTFRLREGLFGTVKAFGWRVIEIQLDRRTIFRSGTFAFHSWICLVPISWNGEE